MQVHWLQMAVYSTEYNECNDKYLLIDIYERIGNIWLHRATFNRLSINN